MLSEMLNTKLFHHETYFFNSDLLICCYDHEYGKDVSMSGSQVFPSMLMFCSGAQIHRFYKLRNSTGPIHLVLFWLILGHVFCPGSDFAWFSLSSVHFSHNILHVATTVSTPAYLPFGQATFHLSKLKVTLLP